VLSDIERLIQLAEQALAAGSESTDAFLLRAGDYLSALERWKSQIESQPPARGTLPKELLQRLDETHRKVSTEAEKQLSSVAAELGGANKKAKALKLYVDRLPQRVTIAGRRKG
jgi:hypothetical protein